MITPIRTLETLKEQFINAVRTNCGDKVTKVVPTGVLNGFAFAMAKLALNINSDTASVEAKLFPEYATGTILDDIANREGVGTRYSATKGTAILLFRGDSGTVVPINTQVKNISGVTYQTLSAITISSRGFDFVQAESLNAGSENFAEYNTLNIMVNTIVGIVSVTNSIRSIGAEDAESDYTYRNRIINAKNILANKTEKYYEALITKYNSSVCRVNFRTQNSYSNSYILNVLKNNGSDFTTLELSDMKDTIRDYMPLTDSLNTSVEINNFSWYDLNMYIPVLTDGTVDISEVIINMQISLLTYLDFTKYEVGKKIQWDDLLEICKRVSGVKEVFDSSFSPNRDIYISSDQLPRLFSFTVKDVITGTEYGITGGSQIGTYRGNTETIYTTGIL